MTKSQSDKPAEEPMETNQVSKAAGDAEKEAKTSKTSKDECIDFRTRTNSNVSDSDSDSESDYNKQMVKDIVQVGNY